MRTTVRFDVDKMLHDMADRGWIARDLSRESGLSDMTISRFLRGELQTARTAKKIATALGYSPRRYVLRRDQGAAA